jgi:hypothetical protein
LQTHQQQSCVVEFDILCLRLIFATVKPFPTTLSGVSFPLPTLEPQWLWTQSQLRTMPKREIGMLRKATPRTRRPLWQTYSRRLARVAATPEGQSAPPHRFIFAERLSPPSRQRFRQEVTPDSWASEQGHARTYFNCVVEG